MERRQLRRIAVASLVSIVLLVASWTPSIAQTWSWVYVSRTPHAPPLPARATVNLARGNLRLTYTVPLRKRQITIESCQSAATDILNAATVRTQGRSYLLVQFKPLHNAACVSGVRAAVALPVEDERATDRIAAALNAACCSSTTAEAATTAAPAATPGPSATPAAPMLVARDWVENDGIFSFVRARNAGPQAFTIRAVAIAQCGRLAFGCGASSREFRLAPGQVVTIATVASTDGSTVPAFNYTYTVVRGSQTLSRSGSAAGTAGRSYARMSAQELRTAEAGALGGLRSAPIAPAAITTAATPPPAPVLAPARLVKRGTSRLAIGQTGTAVMRLTIAESGIPQEAQIVSLTNRRLAAAAIETAVSSTFAPATINGKPIVAKYIATFSFDGEDPATAGIPMWKRSPLPNALSSAAPLPSSSPAMDAPPTPPAPVPTAVPETPAAPVPTAEPATPQPIPDVTATPVPQPTPTPR